MKKIALILCFSLIFTSCSISRDQNGLQEGRGKITSPLTAALPYEVFIEKQIVPAPYEPTAGCYAGAYILGDSIINGDIAAFEALTEKKHGVYLYHMKLGEPYPEAWILDCYVKGKLPMIRIYPTDGYFPFDETYLDMIAEDFGKLNIPVFVDFYPGPSSYAGAKEGYISFYKQAREIFRKKAPLAAFVWSVDSREIYGSKNYYPGDDSVDWVGVGISVDGKEAFNESLWKGLDYFYYAFQSKKPIFITRLEISHYSNQTNTYTTGEASIAIRDFYGRIQEHYPRIKGILYMDYSSIEGVPRRAIRGNCMITAESELLNAYQEAVRPSYFCSFQDKINRTAQIPQLIKSPFQALKDKNGLYISGKTLWYDLGYYENGDMEREGYVNMGDGGEFGAEVDSSRERVIIKK